MRAGAVVEVGARIRFEGRVRTVAGLEGAPARLVTEEGAVAVMLLPHLFADPGFEVVGGPTRGRAPPPGLLETLPEQVRARALAWERDVREVETGSPESDGVVRPGYDPALHTLAEREATKAAELTAAGQPTSVATVRRMRARYREQGVWGLVDRRGTRTKSPLGPADPRVVDAVPAALETQRDHSTGTLTRLRRQVGRILEETARTRSPSRRWRRSTVSHTPWPTAKDSSAARRSGAVTRPTPPFTPTVALRPGELVMVDSTLLDVMVVLDDGVVARPELTIAVDVATRSVCTAVLRPAGTKAVDAAVLLAQQLVAPMRMRPGWADALRTAPASASSTRRD